MNSEILDKISDAFRFAGSGLRPSFHAGGVCRGRHVSPCVHVTSQSCKVSDKLTLTLSGLSHLQNLPVDFWLVHWSAVHLTWAMTSG